MDTRISVKLLLPSEYPRDGRCSAGHFVVEPKYIGNDGKLHANRFLEVTGDALPKSKHGVYCEKCYSRAHRMSIAKRRQKLREA